MRKPGKKYAIASEKAKKVEEGTISASKPKVQKVESDEDESDFECHGRSDCKPVHVDIEKSQPWKAGTRITTKQIGR